MTNTEIKVKRTRKTKSNSTEKQMMVESNTDSSYDVFNGQIIVDSLKRELELSEEDAISIAKKVEGNLLKSNFKTVTSSYIRSLVNQFLTDLGYDKWLKYSSLSIPLYDVKQLIEEHNNENSNTAFSPESINLTVAGQILKQYALREVFNPIVADAHLKGEIHCHDLDFVNRPYCSGNSVEYVKINGLKLSGLTTSSAPARHAGTLVNHLSCFANYLQCYFAGAIGMDCVNMFFAPYLVGLSYGEIKQVAQHLIYSFAQLAGARGGQTAFVDFNMYLRVPSHFKNTPAVGADGKYTGKPYSEYENEMRSFLDAILSVLEEGDANKANFAFPKILLHINESDKGDLLLDKVAAVNSKRGSVYILYDRGKSVKVAQCCRLQLSMSESDTEKMTNHPEEMRFSAWQNISFNLPRMGYKCKTTLQLHKEIDRLMKIVMQGHKDKYAYICKLLDMGTKGCLNFLTVGMDGKPYLRREEAKFLVGILGLNELVQIMTGEQLHESEKALRYGLEIMSYIYKSMQKYAQEAGLTCLLEETPSEGFSLRAALLDLKHCPDAKKYVKGNIETGQVYYTNSVHLAYNAHVDIFTRITKQAKFAPIIQAGAIIHNWLGEHEPNPEALLNLYFKVLTETPAVQTADSPDMTVCLSCHTMSKGLHINCPKCSSADVYQQTRVTGYFSKVSGWPKSKLAELKDRTRVDFNMAQFENKETFTEPEYLFFTKPNCDKCTKIKETLYKHEKIAQIKIVDTATYDGLALSLYYNVDLLPTIMKVKGSKIISKLEQVGSFFKWIKDNIE